MTTKEVFAAQHRSGEGGSHNPALRLGGSPDLSSAITVDDVIDVIEQEATVTSMPPALFRPAMKTITSSVICSPWLSPRGVAGGAGGGCFSRLRSLLPRGGVAKGGAAGGLYSVARGTGETWGHKLHRGDPWPEHQSIVPQRLLKAVGREAMAGRCYLMMIQKFRLVARVKAPWWVCRWHEPAGVTTLRPARRGLSCCCPIAWG